MNESESVGGRTPCGRADRLPTVAEGRPQPLEASDVFDLLSDAQRRRTVEVLLDVEAPVPVETVAAAVVAATPADADGSPAVVRRVVATLRETHLPCLEAYGLVDHHRDRDLVAPRPSIERLAEPLSLANNRAFWRVGDN